MHREPDANSCRESSVTIPKLRDGLARLARRQMQSSTLSTRCSLGASGLEPHWRMMGALEGVDGMLLFSIRTAYIFAINAGLLVTHDPRAQ